MPPAESEEVAVVVIVDSEVEEVGVMEEEEEWLEDVVEALAETLVAALVVVVGGASEDGAVGVLSILVTGMGFPTSIVSLSSQSQQSTLVGSLFLSQHQLPSAHCTMASLPAAVLFEVQYCGQSSPPGNY